MIKGGCQSEKKVLPHNSKSDLPLNIFKCTAEKTPFIKFNLDLTKDRVIEYEIVQDMLR